MPAQQLLSLPAIGAAVSRVTSGALLATLDHYRSLALFANFVYDSAGTTADCWVQTTLDGGATWFDVANFHFTTSSGKAAFNLRNDLSVATQNTTFGLRTLTANTSLDGLLGDQLRIEYQTTGTYGGASSLSVWAVAR